MLDCFPNKFRFFVVVFIVCFFFEKRMRDAPRPGFLTPDQNLWAIPLMEVMNAVTCFSGCHWLTGERYFQSFPFTCTRWISFVPITWQEGNGGSLCLATLSSCCNIPCPALLCINGAACNKWFSNLSTTLARNLSPEEEVGTGGVERMAQCLCWSDTALLDCQLRWCGVSVLLVKPVLAELLSHSSEEANGIKTSDTNWYEQNAHTCLLS